MIGLLTNRFLVGGVAIAALVAGVYFYGERKHREGRAELAAEIAIAAAEKREETSETIGEITDEIANTPDSELADRIIGGGWLLPED